MVFTAVLTEQYVQGNFNLYIAISTTVTNTTRDIVVSSMSDVYL